MRYLKPTTALLTILCFMLSINPAYGYGFSLTQTTDADFNAGTYIGSPPQTAWNNVTGTGASVGLAINSPTYTLTQTAHANPGITPSPTTNPGNFDNISQPPYSGTGMLNTTGSGNSVGLTQWSCNSPFTVTHTAGAVAPVTKTVTYGTVASSLSGSNKCWITQNLGADHQASSLSDNTESSAGWYWQFNRMQGYKNDGATVTPAWTIGSITETSDWSSAIDPCALLLGVNTGWRLPSNGEWTSADSNGAWNNSTDAFNSVLKLHPAGYLSTSDGSLWMRNLLGYGYFWSNSQYSTTRGNYFHFDNTSSLPGNTNKAIGSSVRCINNNLSSSSYNSSGTYTSYVDSGSTQISRNWNTFTWSQTLNSGTIINIQVKSSNSTSAPAYFTVDGTSGGTACTAITTSGQSLSGNNCVSNSDQYLWYHVTLNSPTGAENPTLDQVQVSVTNNNYYSSGTYTSTVLPAGGAANWGTVNWNRTLNSQPEIILKARSCVDINCTGATTWTSCSNLVPFGSGTLLSNGSCVTNLQRFIQYQVGLSSNSPYTVTPTFDDITFAYDIVPDVSFVGGFQFIGTVKFW